MITMMQFRSLRCDPIPTAAMRPYFSNTIFVESSKPSASIRQK